MATKHTEGPWEARIFATREGFGIHAPGKDHSVASANLYEQYAYAAFFTPEETEANARLMSASPELLKELKAAQEELRLIRMKDTQAVYDPGLWVRIEAAIRKAEGAL